jgi:hypothetical protein
MPFSAPFGAVFNPLCTAKAAAVTWHRSIYFVNLFSALVPFLFLPPPPLLTPPTTNVQSAHVSSYPFSVYIQPEDVDHHSRYGHGCCDDGCHSVLYKLSPSPILLVASSNPGSCAILCGYPIYSEPSSESSTLIFFTFTVYPFSILSSSYRPTKVYYIIYLNLRKLL